MKLKLGVIIDKKTKLAGIVAFIQINCLLVFRQFIILLILAERIYNPDN